MRDRMALRSIKQTANPCYCKYDFSRNVSDTIIRSTTFSPTRQSVLTSHEKNHENHRNVPTDLYLLLADVHRTAKRLRSIFLLLDPILVVAAKTNRTTSTTKFLAFSFVVFCATSWLISGGFQSMLCCSRPLPVFHQRVSSYGLAAAVLFFYPVPTQRHCPVVVPFHSQRSVVDK